MANLKEVRERISSVITTQQITKAMKLVAASKLKKATDNITAMRPYSDKLFSILENILSNVDVDSLDLDFGKEREVKNVLIVLATSDKGLCGGFNANLNKRTKALINEEYANLKGGNITIATVGKKGYDFFKSFEGVKLETTYRNLFTDLNFEHASKAAEYAMNSYLDGTYDKVHVVYAKFINAATQEYNVEQFLPIAKFEAKEGDMNVDFEFEPDKADLVKELVPKILKTQFYRFLLDNNASEHGARMVAMDQATENANTLLNDLKLLYNRERQAAITTEILEIVGGAAALENG
ncbi:MAG: ATP synthase F1 subunit gamma [Chitinophagales bacterium]|nr:ATP synthase F1 subunit gamma [Bacteroidota bacterium]MCB9226503.1 ATP synthase F1 subunit gamma [Chitinophagales bacterium]